MKPKPLSLSDLAPAPRNPRSISDQARQGLSVSLSEFGDLSGIVFNRHAGRKCLVAGHQRLAALRALYGDQLRMADGAVVTPAGERFPVRVVDWDELKEKAANLAANNPAIQGEFTADAALLLDEIGAELPELAAGLMLDEIRAELPETQEVKLGVVRDEVLSVPVEKARVLLSCGLEDLVQVEICLRALPPAVEILRSVTYEKD